MGREGTKNGGFLSAEKGRVGEGEGKHKFRGWGRITYPKHRNTVMVGGMLMRKGKKRRQEREKPSR